ncbi:hypothetical protein HG531_004075 [Fusarium graminearum]|nr:hypothetical protein HG531_004075 [Fusarium graminearum]
MLEDHLSNLPLDIAGLISNRDLGETRQIDEGQELLSWGMEEFSPLVGVGLLVVGGVNFLGAGAIALCRTVDELENEGTSSYDTGASRQAEKDGQFQAHKDATQNRRYEADSQISANNILQN